MVNMAILGVGGIAESMAKTVQLMAKGGDRSVRLYAAASRSQEKADAFAKKWEVPKAYGSYEAMLDDKDVDLVYVATPHAFHYSQMLSCVAAGKHVLCEKAFTANAAQAADVLRRGREAGLLVAEAIWTRYMPSRGIIDGLIRDGAVGDPKLLTANLCYEIGHVPRIQRPELCGGALLDIGVYVLNFASMVFGDGITRRESVVDMLDTGVDRQETVTQFYSGSRMAVLTAAVTVIGDRAGCVFGSGGAIRVENINNPQRVFVYRQAWDPEPERVIPVPVQHTGYEYEVLSCVKAIREGRTECPEMPHSQIVEIMSQMDALRASWGMRFPCEDVRTD